MNLCEKIKDLIGQNISVEFRNDFAMVRITLRKEGKTPGLYRKIEQSIPFSDHFYESKLIDLLTWMENKLKSESI